MYISFTFILLLTLLFYFLYIPIFIFFYYFTYYFYYTCLTSVHCSLLCSVPFSCYDSVAILFLQFSFAFTLSSSVQYQKRKIKIYTTTVKMRAPQDWMESQRARSGARLPKKLSVYFPIWSLCAGTSRRNGIRTKQFFYKKKQGRTGCTLQTIGLSPSATFCVVHIGASSIAGLANILRSLLDKRDLFRKQDALPTYMPSTNCCGKQRKRSE